MSSLLTDDALYEDFSALTPVSIPDAADRAVTLNQLLRVFAYVERHCEAEGWTNSRSGAALTPATVTLYDVADRVIRPFTEAHECSFAELVAEEEQPADYFVSHWWGEPVVDFLACLRQHVDDHALGSRDPDTGHYDGEGARYWVCAYANNQWRLEEEMSSDPSDSAFGRAIEKARGGLTMMDREGVVFSRVWCGFETFRMLNRDDDDDDDGEEEEGRRFPYDFYTVSEYECEGRGTNARLRETEAEGSTYPVRREAVGITDGACESDGSPPHHFWAKSDREAGFPGRLARMITSVSVEKANASVESDKTTILNCFLGRTGDDLKEEPPETSEVYDDINRRLRAKMMAPMWLTLVESGLLDEECAETVRSGNVTKWEIMLRTNNFGDAEASLTARALPPSLRELNLDWMFDSGTTETGSIAVYEAAARCESLESLRLVSDHGEAAVPRFCAALREESQRRDASSSLRSIDFNSSEVKDEGGAALIEIISDGYLPELTQLKIFDFSDDRKMRKELHDVLVALCEEKEIYLAGQWY